MSDADRLTPANPEDLADALAFALRYSGRKRVNDAGEMMAAIVAKRLVEHLVFVLQPEIDAADAAFDAAMDVRAKAQNAMFAASPPRPTRPEPVPNPDQDRRDKELREFLNRWQAENTSLAAGAQHQEELSRWQEARDQLEVDHGVVEAQDAEKEAADAVTSIQELLVGTPATTIEGLIFKARYAATHYRDDYDDDVMTSIVDDLLALGKVAAV